MLELIQNGWKMVNLEDILTKKRHRYEKESNTSPCRLSHDKDKKSNYKVPHEHLH